jgi:hemolysin activation/secretion protein
MYLDIKQKFNIAPLSKIIFITTIFGSFLSATLSHAQVPSSLEPSRLQDLKEPLLERKAQPPIVIPPSEKNEPPEGAQSLSFTYSGLRIDGATVLTQDSLAALFPHKLGETLTVRDIFQLADAISVAYRKAGYALSFATVPQQEINDGKFRIVVVEGFVDKITIEGVPEGKIRDRISALASKITQSRPLRTADLERSLLLINDLPGLRVSGVLSPAQVHAGALLTLKAEHQALAGQVSYDNMSSKALGPDMGEVGGEVRGLLTGSDSVSLRVRRALTSKAYETVTGDMSTGLGSNGLRVGLRGSWAQSDPKDAILDAINYRTKSWSGSVYADYPLIRSRDQNLRVGGSLGIEDSRSIILGQDFTHDRLPELKLWTAYDFVDATMALTDLRVTLTKGLDQWGAKGDSRADGVVDYTTLEFDALRNQPITTVFGGALSAQISAHGQKMIGSGGLFSGAECAFGGWQYGRGFVSGTQTGDQCLQGSGELHWTQQAKLPALGKPVFFDLYGFVDGGLAQQKNSPALGKTSDNRAASYGLGLNSNITPTLSSLILITRQWTLKNEADPAAAKANGQTRLVVWLRKRF